MARVRAFSLLFILSGLFPARGAAQDTLQAASEQKFLVPQTIFVAEGSFKMGQGKPGGERTPGTYHQPGRILYR